MSTVAQECDDKRFDCVVTSTPRLPVLPATSISICREPTFKRMATSPEYKNVKAAVLRQVAVGLAFLVMATVFFQKEPSTLQVTVDQNSLVPEKIVFSKSSFKEPFQSQQVHV